MKGVHFKQANIVLKAPQGMEDDCYDLHACRYEDGANQKRWRKWLHAVRLRWDTKYRARYIGDEVKKAFKASGIGAES